MSVAVAKSQVIITLAVPQGVDGSRDLSAPGIKSIKSLSRHSDCVE
jgi:hypothetical protein